ncbi:MAG: energy transducer TonB [Nitrospiraceae bacterium]|nr:energy transducer TonB [Nitrospiraceae bacterium]
MIRSHSFRGPIALSIAIHIAFLGSALAFARFSGLTGGTTRSLTVSLVRGEGGGGSGARSAPAAPRNERAIPPAPVIEEPRTEPVAARKIPVEENAEGFAESAASLPGGAAAAGPGKTGGGKETTGAAATGNGDSGGGYSSEQWRQLQRAIERVKSYPRLARERGIEGVVRLRFRVLPSGQVGPVAIVQSSGATILDEASVRTVRQAGPVPVVDGWVEVPMVYTLSREGER